MTEARAPGKLLLLGEYAVLEGAPAIVAAVDRHVLASAPAAADDVWRVEAVNLDAPVAVWDGADGARSGPLALCLRLLDALDARGALPSPRHCRVDSAAFYAHGVKLGLGSSAAVSVALWRALGEPGVTRGDFPAAFELLRDVHSAQQSGRGSGVDIAAALRGGVSVFARRAGRVQADAVALPPTLHWQALDTGAAASTGAALATLADWRARNERDYRARMDALTSCARAGVDALRAGRAGAFCTIAGQYTDALDALGGAVGLDIVSAGHRVLRSRAADCGVVYKPSGAGGGDLGVALAVDADSLQTFCSAAAAAGEAKPLNLRIAAAAVQ